MSWLQFPVPGCGTAQAEQGTPKPSQRQEVPLGQRPDTPAEEEEEEEEGPGGHQRRRRGPGGGGCAVMAAALPLAPRPRPAAASPRQGLRPHGQAELVTVQLPATKASAGTAGRPPGPVRHSRGRAGQGRPSTNRVLTPPPPLSGPAGRPSPAPCLRPPAPGRSPAVASARDEPRSPPRWPQPRPPRRLFSSALAPAAAGDARGRHVTARRVAGAEPSGPEAAPRPRGARARRAVRVRSICDLRNRWWRCPESAVFCLTCGGDERP